MLRFDPPELREDLAVAIEAWKRKVESPRDGDFSDDLVDVALPGFDPAGHEDRTITPKTEFGLFLPKWEYTKVISYGGFVVSQGAGAGPPDRGVRLLDRPALPPQGCFGKRSHLRASQPPPPRAEVRGGAGDPAVVHKMGSRAQRTLEET